nr:P-loop NTPase fold protein [uncultured Flavobacterium sp.]
MIKKDDFKKVTKIISNLINNYKNEVTLLIFIVTLYILFHYPINSLLTKFLIDSCLKYIYAQKWYNDLIYYNLILFLVYRVYTHWQKQYYLNRAYSILFSITIIYIINRTLQTWNFHSTYIFKHIYYSDILILLSVLTLILIFKTYYFKIYSKENSQKEEFGFITDRPIEDDNEDKLQYTNYANAIATKIVKTKAEKSFAIGVNGKWGTGKTSFLNLIKKKIKKENVEIILIDFCAWNTESHKSIMTDFFETFEEKLTHFNSNISKQISNYSEKLLLLNEIETTKPFYSFLSIFFGKTKTLSELKCDLEKNIENLNKKIIVFIDDLDRLDNSEINEVLKLIRNTADFKNTFFVVAYDKNYITNALTNLNTYNKEGFLEKIFQVEINLPYYEKSELCKKLFENLLLFFPDKKDLLENCVLRKKIDGEINIIYENIHSMRDVILLSNSLILNYENLKGNVDFNNLMYLEILRIKYPNIYDILKNKNDEFIYFDKKSNGYYNLRSIESETTLYKILDSNNIEINIDFLSINKIKQIVNELFNSQKINFLSLRNVSKYENYFSYRLLEKTLDENKFQETIKKDLVSIKKQITIWIEKEFEFDLVRRFSSINNYKSKLDYQNNLFLIFYIANHKSNKSENIIGFDSTIIQHRFGYYKNFKEIDYSFEDHKKFIKNLLMNAEFPFVFEANLIHELNSKINNSSVSKFPLTKDELTKISERYLDSYIKNHNALDKNLLHILSANSAFKSYPTNKYDFLKNTRDKVQHYFNNQPLDTLIKICISKDGNTYNITPQIFGIFGSTQLVKNYFNERLLETNSELCKEFLTFLDYLKPENTSIRYEFDLIDI